MQFTNALRYTPSAPRFQNQPPQSQAVPMSVMHRLNPDNQSVDKLIYNAKDCTWFISVTPTARYARPAAETIIENLTELNARQNLTPEEIQKTKDGYHTIKKDLEKAIRHHLGLSREEPLFLEPLNRFPKIALLAKTLKEVRNLESEFNQLHQRQTRPVQICRYQP